MLARRFIAGDERGELREVSWTELRAQVASLAAALRELGVAPGDRVVAFLPNVPQTIVAFLACASLGAIWSVCSPDMGPLAVLDRFRQIEPKVLIACDGYRYGGKAHDRVEVLAEMLAALPSVAPRSSCHCCASDVDGRAFSARTLSWTRADSNADARFAPSWCAFDHPLWVVYSSGTTGLPKAIVHGHGGVLLEMLKGVPCTTTSGPATASTGTRSTGWIMWNVQVGGLLAAPPSAVRRASRARRTSARCGASPSASARPSSAPARRSTPAA